jgi:hypothetical protein
MVVPVTTDKGAAVVATNPIAIEPVAAGFITRGSSVFELSTGELVAVPLRSIANAAVSVTLPAWVTTTLRELPVVGARR